MDENANSANFVDEPEKDLPLEVYNSVVRSLHGDSRALFVGKFATWLAILAVWYRTGSTEIMIVGILTVIIGLFRIASVKKFLSLAEDELDLKALEKREKIYLYWAATYVFLLGAVCFVGMAVTSDDVVHLITVSSTLAYIIGIAGRNFASAKVVNVQVAAVSVPLIGGLIMFGGVYHNLLGCLLAPFMIAMHSISARLRQMLFDAVFTAMDNKLIADRFEIALKNVSHGIAMVDHQGSIVVVNQRFNEIFGLKKRFNSKGATMADLQEQEFLNNSTTANGNSLGKRLEHCLTNKSRQKFQFQRSDGVVIEVSFTPIASYTGVIVLEDISERIKSEAEIQQLANFDSLTHLPNRRYFSQTVEEVCKTLDEDEGYSIFFMDVDKFKDINDTLGHSVGDKLLCVISLRMKACLPKGGFVGRFGGDEFTIMLPGISDRDICERFVKRVIEEVSKPVLIDGHLIVVGASAGIAVYPENSDTFEQLLKMADVSLYEAKAQGRGSFYFYSDELGSRIKDRMELEVDLRKSVEAGELEVYYQPLVDIKRNEVTCCEALLRWHHPTKGSIPPSIFIPIAEEIGMIGKIGKFVMEEATKECMLWPNQVRVAVNVSSLQFQQTDVCAVVNQALIKSGLVPSRLEVEVTETAMIDDLVETSRVLRTLSQSGVKVSLDDFGTGFSSLSYLHQLPLDKVKIDKSFVDSIRHDRRSLTLLIGVSKIASDLGLQIIVEGVEEVEQLEILKKGVHLDQVQGYLFSKPMPAVNIREYIAKNVGVYSEIQNLSLRA